MLRDAPREAPQASLGQLGVSAWLRTRSLVMRSRPHCMGHTLIRGFARRSFRALCARGRCKHFGRRHMPKGEPAPPAEKLPRARWILKNASWRRSSASRDCPHKRKRNMRRRGATCRYRSGKTVLSPLAYRSMHRLSSAKTISCGCPTYFSRSSGVASLAGFGAVREVLRAMMEARASENAPPTLRGRALSRQRKRANWRAPAR